MKAVSSQELLLGGTVTYRLAGVNTATTLKHNEVNDYMEPSFESCHSLDSAEHQLGMVCVTRATDVFSEWQRDEQ